MLKIEADGSQAIRALGQLEREIVAGVRREASATGAAIRDTARTLVPVRTGVTRDSIVSRDGEDATNVFVDLPADVFPNLDAVLEFGRSDMEARPFLWPSVEQHRVAHQRRMERVLELAARKASG